MIGLECKSLNEQLVKNVTCLLRISRDVRLINVDLLLGMEVVDIHINLALYYKTPLGFRPFPMNTTENLCEFLHGTQKQKVLWALLNSVRDSFYNVKCPTSGHIGIRDANVQLQDFGVIPSGTYRFDLTFIFNGNQPAFIVKGTAQYNNLVLYKV